MVKKNLLTQWELRRKPWIVVCAQIHGLERYIEEERNITRARSIKPISKISEKLRTLLAGDCREKPNDQIQYLLKISGDALSFDGKNLQDLKMKNRIMYRKFALRSWMARASMLGSDLNAER